MGGEVKWWACQAHLNTYGRGLVPLRTVKKGWSNLPVGETCLRPRLRERNSDPSLWPCGSKKELFYWGRNIKVLQVADFHVLGCFQGPEFSSCEIITFFSQTRRFWCFVSFQTAVCCSISGTFKHDLGCSRPSTWCDLFKKRLWYLIMLPRASKASEKPAESIY